jgi:hypothetical protein
MTQATTAVANTIPAGIGAAMGIGLTYTMLGSWGYSRSRTTTAVLVSGVWNSFIKLGLPVLALALVALQGGAAGGRVIAALLGIAGLAAAIVVFALMLRSEEQARRFGLLAGRAATRLLGLLRRPPVAGWELATVKFRARTVGLSSDAGSRSRSPRWSATCRCTWCCWSPCATSGSATSRSPGPRCWPCSPSRAWPPPSRSPPAAPGSSKPC